MIEPRAARVLRVVAIGARIADPADPLGIEARRDLPNATGLSPEGVELALRDHLETSVSEADLASLLASVGTAPKCHVVLAANVCTAALRAIALAVATASRVAIRPSRRDPILARLLARALGEDEAFAAAGGAIEIVEQIEASSGDELHVYGADETIAAITASTNKGVLVRGHGTGLGVALLGAAADLVESASALAADVVPFDQRGCLSPRVALIDGGPERAIAFAEALDESLRTAALRVPRGPLDPEDRAAIAMYLASVSALGKAWEGPNHAVGIDLAPRALVLPPPARVVHVVPASPAEAAALLAPWERAITAIGKDSSADPLPIAPKARRSPLGRMQRPPLDGPVDRRGS